MFSPDRKKPDLRQQRVGTSDNGDVYPTFVAITFAITESNGNPSKRVLGNFHNQYDLALLDKLFFQMSWTLFQGFGEQRAPSETHDQINLF
jgi:hypothetical protein